MAEVSKSMSNKNAVITPFYEVMPDLFQMAHKWQLFADGKLWADAEPIYPMEKILAEWNLVPKDKSSVSDFISGHFRLPAAGTDAAAVSGNISVEAHIKNLWSSLFRKGGQAAAEGSSLITIPFDYVVPGGRFNEIYYWDSYFTMLGLAIHGHTDMIREMTKNFAYFIDRFGFVPNGNRSYFLSRSQPPFFGLMVDLLAGVESAAVYEEFLPQMVKEHSFWMGPLRTHHFEDGKVLNRYADAKAEPREEMYRDDLLEGKKVANPSTFFSHLRAACESGWDFSSRWMRQAEDLTSIHTHDIIPVDLNALLYALEMMIAKGYAFKGEHEHAEQYTHKAADRKSAMEQYCWNGFWTDHHTDKKEASPLITAASIVPLFTGLSNQDQAQKTHDLVYKHLLKPGGICTTTLNSGQQWDAPNGWAPLQWMAVAGLSQYGFMETARTIAHRWISLNEKVYRETGKMLEKYNVENPDLPGGGGEYPVQDGFGWTNGVYLALQSWLTEKDKI